jgi:hypothetical protein
LDLKNNTDGTEDYLDHLSTGQWNESVNELINILKNKILKKDAAIKTFNKNTDKEVLLLRMILLKLMQEILLIIVLLM